MSSPCPSAQNPLEVSVPPRPVLSLQIHTLATLGSWSFTRKRSGISALCICLLIFFSSRLTTDLSRSLMSQRESSRSWPHSC